MPSRAAASFLLRLLVLYALLMAPWPGLSRAYGFAFRSVCKLLEGPVGSRGQVTLLPAQDGDRRDTLFLLQKRGTSQVARNGVISRYTGYLPTALLIALVLATPLGWERRRRGLVLGLVSIHAFIGFRVALSVYSDFLTVAGVALADVGAIPRALLSVFTELVSDTIASVVAAIVVWILVLFRREDWALIVSGPGPVAGRVALLAALAWLPFTLPHVRAAEPWQRAEEDHVWSFPRDHWAHREFALEWWYFTGHLESVERPARTFGYQFTLFRVGLAPGRSPLDSAWATAHLVLGHAAVTDPVRGEHRFTELLYRESPLLAGFEDPPGPRIAWSRGPAGTAEPWTLDWNGEAFDLAMADASRGIALRLATRPLKPLVFQGPNGLSVKSGDAESASLYYSFTRLETRGEIVLDGERFAVRGQSWMDHEIGAGQLAGRQVGWDWFGLRLDDGREIMLYVLRSGDGAVDHAAGTRVAPDGTPRYLSPKDWSLRRTATWRSSESGIEYPAGWDLDLPSLSLRLRIRPVLADQENRSGLPAGPNYWEGAVEVVGRDGRHAGVGHVELTGYGEAGPLPAWP